MLSDIQTLARRLEQQLIAHERMYADDLKRLQEQFSALEHIQRDELQMFRDELNQLNQEIAALKEQPVAAPQTAEPTLTRRDLLTGNLRPTK